MFALVDCNNFYVSVERVFNPKLKNRPVIVLSNNDGCAISRSNEAKALGIQMAQPAFYIKDIIEKHKVAVCSSNYTLYGDMSRRVMETLREFVPRIEEYSIDEAFLDLSELRYQNLTELATEIRGTVLQATGIPTCIGIAPTKTLAKMANRYAKKVKKEVGVHSITTKEEIEQVLKFTAIEEVWNIGAQYAKKLQAVGVNTVFDLLQFSDDWMRHHMTVQGQRLLNELKGISCIPLEEKPAAKKNICTSRSFGVLLTELKDIKEAVANHAARCAEKLRRQQTCAGSVHVFLETNRFREQDQQYYSSLTIPLPVATNNTQEIMLYVFFALNRIYQQGYNYKKVGVIVQDIVPENEVQQGLFDRRPRVKENYVIEAVDRINRSYGKDLVKYAVMGNGRKWKLRQEKLSPCYTTRLSDILTIQI
ncbi:MAG: Y-family DNA polymerase [Flavisolibacter sp.]|nr:Y-family DNA polymerase [Flavisolibacter sp.]